jgi:hypothetical protein
MKQRPLISEHLIPDSMPASMPILAAMRRGIMGTENGIHLIDLLRASDVRSWRNRNAALGLRMPRGACAGQAPNPFEACAKVAQVYILRCRALYWQPLNGA